MKIVMMARNPDLYSHKRLKEAAEARGHSWISSTPCGVT